MESYYFNLVCKHASIWRHLWRDHPRIDESFPSRLVDAGITSWKDIYENCTYCPQACFRPVCSERRIWHRGDVLSKTADGYHYRNNDKVMFDGLVLVDLNRELTDYGSVSGCFRAIEEFPPYYWQDLMDDYHYLNVDVVRLGWKDVLNDALSECLSSVLLEHNSVRYRCKINYNGDSCEHRFVWEEVVPYVGISYEFGSVLECRTDLDRSDSFLDFIHVGSPDEFNVFTLEVPYADYRF